MGFTVCLTLEVMMGLDSNLGAMRSHGILISLMCFVF